MSESKKVICHDINNKEELIEIDKLIFRPSVYGILIEDNKVLLSKKWDGYDFPGGGIEMHETVEEALWREFKEETGIIVESGEIVGCETSFLMIPSFKKYVNAVLIYFLCNKTGGKISTKYFSESEKKYASEAEWIEINDLDKIKFYNPVDSVKMINEASKLLK